jgi:hypothetical protein
MTDLQLFYRTSLPYNPLNSVAIARMRKAIVINQKSNSGNVSRGIIPRCNRIPINPKRTAIDQLTFLGGESLILHFSFHGNKFNRAIIEGYIGFFDPDFKFV